MVEFYLNESSGIVFVKPSGLLQSEDIDAITKSVDDYIEKTGILSGLLIELPQCRGWSDLQAFKSHMGFIEKHHMKVARVAIVGDNLLLSIIPKIADLFLLSDVKHHSQIEDAMNWLVN
ncbi:MAG: STAS/SEC14 domain-containing protein [Sulfurimonadaceae bacterium]|nr:STAS/SEC14 domain-containing protein [Sulfurimonadaceae bacterium]